jgi:putative two-component system response regulator
MTSPILVVDDEPSNLATLRQILAGHYPVVFARNGMEMQAAAAKHHPALILLDIQMPDMDGITACRKLKANPKLQDIPVIFVTSLAETGDETAGFEAGAVDYIVKPVSPPIVLARVRTHLSLVSTKRLEQSYMDAIQMLGLASRFKDADTGSHIWRMASYSRLLAEAKGWSADACRMIELAAPMHDIGKLGIPDAIMHKPGKLNPDERAIIETHSAIGYEILRASDGPILQMAATIAHHHHERWDGTGYPCRLAASDIPEAARIVAVADVFDALTMPRPYKEAWPLERVLETMRAGAGQHFDPVLIDLLTAIMPQILTVQAESRERDLAEAGTTQ